ncbi:TolC family protein [soil metagenome]
MSRWKLAALAFVASLNYSGMGFAQTVPSPNPVVATPAITVLTLDDFVKAAIERHPRVMKATFAVDAAQGKFTQAGLYPNPVFAFNADELGDRTGTLGILTPQVSQEIVRGGKLKLSQAIVAKEIDQATLAVMAERFAVIGAVRAAFYDVYALQERRIVLAEIVRINEDTVSKLEPAVKAGIATPLDLVQLEIERETRRAELKAIEQELPNAFRRLAAIVGENELPPVVLAASFELPLPEYDGERTRAMVVALHPEIRSAKVGVERAQAALLRAQAEPKPNITVSSGYTRQNQNRSNDWLLAASLPLPTWNKNQGGIRMAIAEIQIAHQDVRRVENDLAERVATSLRTYSAAKQRAEWYRDHILGRTNEALKLMSKARDAGQFNAIQVLQAQKAVAEARLETNKSLGEAWKAAGEISGMLLEEQWPLAIAVPQNRETTPMK